MRTIFEKKELIERVHLLIRRRGTGSPEELADKLGVSKSSVHRVIETMKSFGAPIVFNISRQSYEYEYPVEFYFGFFSNAKIKEIDGKEIHGGILKKPQINFSQCQNLRLAFNFFR